MKSTLSELTWVGIFVETSNYTVTVHEKKGFDYALFLQQNKKK